jgi:hypothetical protein
LVRVVRPQRAPDHRNVVAVEIGNDPAMSGRAEPDAADAELGIDIARRTDQPVEPLCIRPEHFGKAIGGRVEGRG